MSQSDGSTMTMCLPSADVVSNGSTAFKMLSILYLTDMNLAKARVAAVRSSGWG